MRNGPTLTMPRDTGFRLETQRLRLRAYGPDDLDMLAELYGAPEVASRTKLGVLTRDQCADVLADYLQCWRQNGYGMRMIADREGRSVGECGLFTPASVSAPAIRYVLDAACWGRGYASEAVAATLEDGFLRLRLDRIYGFVEHDNPASHRVLQKAGFHVEDVVDSAKGDLSRYVLERDSPVMTDRR